MIALSLHTDAHDATLVLSDEVAADLLRGDTIARRTVLHACAALVDAFVTSVAAARHDLN